MRSRLALLAGIGAGAALLAPAAVAAPTVVISDATGDAKGNQPAYDLVSVSMETTRVSTAKNAKLKDFRIVMQLAGTPEVQPGTSYQVVGEHAECGMFFAYVYWSAVETAPTTSVQFAQCGEPDEVGQESYFVDTTARIEGSTIVFSMPATSLPPEVEAGSLFENLVAYTAVTEPSVGFSALDFAPDEADDALALDYATATRAYKYGS
jgi:hypothetical protein